MKRMTKFTIIFLAMSFICFGMRAQTTSRKIPEWVSEKGYWVVRENIHSTIFFYNNNNEEVYRETVTVKGLKLKKKEVLICLKNILDTAVTAWKRRQPLLDESGLFATSMKKR